MCGIFGVVACAGRSPSISDQQAIRLRDMLAHRGPDGAGLHRDRNALLTHRRLAVVDLSDTGAQPISTPDGRFTLVYNGELYNDAELRRALAARGVQFRGRSDAHTVLHALEQWGASAIRRFRGMFALALWDSLENTLTLARDPLGVKPLYFAQLAHEIVFASEPPPILAHTDVSPRPNLSMVSAYLTTIRTVLGNDTLFEGVHALAPAQIAICSLAGDAPTIRLVDYWDSPPIDESLAANELDAAARVHDALADSLSRHLRADAPLCALLSGGLDSTILTALAARQIASLHTYCAGAQSEHDNDDISSARRIAHALNTRHAETIITRERFAAAWPDMIDRLGVPLSTPNEVAIHAVAKRLRADGHVVALSGEGADELFAGYEAPLLASLQDIDAARRRHPNSGRTPGAFELASAAWLSAADKAAALLPNVWEAVDHDAGLAAFYDREFERCAASCRANAADEDDPHDALDARLRLQRRINLTGLLQRLDTAAMLAGVEGRTPFADAHVAALAESLPMSLKFQPCHRDRPGDLGANAPTVLTAPQTKIILRRAFADSLPAESLERPKASFPLPFQSWLADKPAPSTTSPFARAIFTPEAITTVAQDPTTHWRAAWPMTNIALWGNKHWGG